MPRTKGAVSKNTLAASRVFAKRKFDTLNEMMDMVESTKDEKVRADLLKSLAPYQYPKLQNTILSGDKDRPLRMKVKVGLSNE